VRLLVVLSIATACHRVDHAPPAEPRPAQPQLQKYVEPLARPGFTGRVFFGSSPVTHFGVAVVRDHRELLFLRPTFKEVHSRDGWFRIAGPPGTWDVVIVAPGFPRKILHQRAVEELRSTDLGMIELARPIVTQGHVRDSAGRPVAGASVSINQSSFAADDGSFAAMAAGNIRTSTDASGHFSLSGVTEIEIGSRPTIVAEHQKLRSHELPVPTGNVTLDLVVLPMGTIEGHTPTDDRRVIISSMQPRAAYIAPIQDHRFVFDIPAGNYTLLTAPGKLTKQVTVAPNATSTVTFP
jgi:hypothetical protein